MLETFFTGILNRLQAEVDFMNALVSHGPTKGGLNEESLRRVLAAFLPARYETGTGFVVDSFGNRSAQVDIIVHDGIYSSRLFKTFSQVVFPVETTYACLEVKTGIDRGGLGEIAQENRLIAALKHYAPSVGRIAPSTRVPNAIDVSELNTRPPMTYLVCYRTGTDSPSTVRKWFEESKDRQHLPDMSLFLDLGMVVFRPKPVELLTFDFLLMPIRNTDVGSTDKGILYAREPNKALPLNGRLYRSSKWKGKSGHPVIMPERALLLFLIQMTRALDHFPKHEMFDPTAYLTKFSDEGLEVLPES